MLQTKKRVVLRDRSEPAFAPNPPLLLLCAIWYCFVLWRIQIVLDGHFNVRNLLDEMRSSNMAAPLPPEDPPQDRFLIFVGSEDGSQGQGNILNGLLAAHLLGLEFNYAVCVWDQWTEFNLAFRQKHYVRECEEVQKLPATKKKRMRHWTFGSSETECTLREKLASDRKVWEFSANTYPKWPTVPDGFFEEYYEPTEALSSVLPWKDPPETVMHLRQGDGGNKSDRRKGVDEQTFEALGKALPSDTFLVTNEVPWYRRFSDRYGWSNAGWDSVRHSARHKNKNDPRVEGSLTEYELEVLRLYSDWYTLLKADKVYHTASDFSQSAVHFMGRRDSKVILGTTRDGGLKVVDESWIRDGETEILKIRTLKEGPCGN